ncbi:hypothetical protein BN1080_00930 [Planococcus massiliensis]|uniref:Uncharacterized protein n=1 Tax=Planococcus massiliensis TaxID=1499687 RepID=A0A098EJM8_9BACL|nr:hypothetical protein BN1080_00930 [Planococcus massiliensis]
MGELGSFACAKGNFETKQGNFTLAEEIKYMNGCVSLAANREE